MIAVRTISVKSSTQSASGVGVEETLGVTVGVIVGEFIVGVKNADSPEGVMDVIMASVLTAAEGPLNTHSRYIVTRAATTTTPARADIRTLFFDGGTPGGRTSALSLFFAARGTVPGFTSGFGLRFLGTL